MAKKPLSDEQVEAFRKIASVIVEIDTLHEAEMDWDGHKSLLKQMWNTLPPDDYERFASLVRESTDGEARSPK